MIRKDDVYRIGRIGKPHGVAGEVTLNFDDDVFDRTDAEYLVLDIDGILVPFFFDEYRFKTDTTALMKFAGIDTQDRARELTGCDVYFPRHIADTQEHVSLSMTNGFTMLDANSGHAIGTIVGVDDTTANTLFEVQAADGEQLLIPVCDEFIDSVDTSKRTITMRLPDGLLDLNKL